MSATRLTAGERLERLLSIIPTVAASSEGAALDELAERFDYPPDDLLADLNEVVFLVGLYPFSPDQLIEVMVEDRRVWIRYAEYFEHSLRLSAGEALALVAAGQSLLAAPGADEDGPLGRGLRKLAVSLGLGDDSPVEVTLGGADAEVLDALRTGVAEAREVEIDYYSFGRDQRSRRVIEPQRVGIVDGNWYVFGHCHQAEADRLFRVDRIDEAVVRDATFEPPDQTPDIAVFATTMADPRVTLTLAPEASWVGDYYPHDRIDEVGDGSIRVTLPVSAVPWLERLLLRLGPSASIVDADPSLPGDTASAAARRIRDRYRRP